MPEETEHRALDAEHRVDPPIADRRRSIPELDLPAVTRVLRALRSAASPHPVRGATLEALPAVPGYVIECVLGEGSGGVVCRARREGSELHSALKIFHRRLGSSPAAQRAWRELDLLAQLRSTSVPRLLDHGTVDGRLFIATELIEGRSAADHCDAHDLTLRDRVELLARIADAVQSLHERGVLHRDLKPQNIVVDTHGQPMLVDFGISTLLDHDPEAAVTADGTPVGTPAFMSPEQARGDLATISTRSDVYGLGATAYVLLTGQTPHACDGGLHDAIRRVAQESPRDPRTLSPSLPKPLVAVLLRAVAPDPANRYPSAAEFAAELRRWLAGHPVEAGGMSVSQRLGRWVAHHPLTVTSGLALAIMLTSVVTAASVNWRYNRSPASLELDSLGTPAIVLRSRSGKELHRWRSNRTDAFVTKTMLLDRPREAGGGRVALINFGLWDVDFEHRLALFDLKRPGSPIWTTARNPESVPMPTAISRQGPDGTMHAYLHLIADFFPTEPAPQFAVALMRGPFSATCIQIVGWDGRVLHQFWHDGVPEAMRWLEHERILVVSAVNSEGTLQERGFPEVRRRSIPIVFAHRPQLGVHHVEWIRFEGGGGTLEPLWYRALLPLEDLGRLPREISVRFALHQPAVADSRRHLMLDIVIPDGRGEYASILMPIDPDTGLSDAGTPCDLYKTCRARDPDRFPDPAVFHLGAVPPASPWPSD